jgi:hypothetical protein
MARKIRKDVLTIDPVFLSNAEMLANRVERMELRPTKHYYQVKFIGGYGTCLSSKVARRGLVHQVTHKCACRVAFDRACRRYRACRREDGSHLRASAR